APLMRLQLARTAALAVVISVPLAAAAIYQLWLQRDRKAAIILAALAVAWGVAHGATAAAIVFCLAVAIDAASTRGWIQRFVEHPQRFGERPLAGRLPHPHDPRT